VNRLRKWITPLVTGTFALVAATGLLLFFRAASPLAHAAHEWLSWALLLAAVVHLSINARALGTALRSRAARGILAACALLTAASLLPVRVGPGGHGGHGGSPEHRAFEALLDAPLPTVAALAGRSPVELRQVLAREGLQVPGDRASLRQIAQASGTEPERLLGRVFR
jgi:hypothetical protein